MRFIILSRMKNGGVVTSEMHGTLEGVITETSEWASTYGAKWALVVNDSGNILGRYDEPVKEKVKKYE